MTRQTAKRAKIANGLFFILAGLCCAGSSCYFYHIGDRPKMSAMAIEAFLALQGFAFAWIGIKKIREAKNDDVA